MQIHTQTIANPKIWKTPDMNYDALSCCNKMFAHHLRVRKKHTATTKPKGQNTPNHPIQEGEKLEKLEKLVVYICFECRDVSWQWCKASDIRESRMCCGQLVTAYERGGIKGPQVLQNEDLPVTFGGAPQHHRINPVWNTKIYFKGKVRDFEPDMLRKLDEEILQKQETQEIATSTFSVPKVPQFAESKRVQKLSGPLSARRAVLEHGA